MREIRERTGGFCNRLIGGSARCVVVDIIVDADVDVVGGGGASVSVLCFFQAGNDSEIDGEEVEVEGMEVDWPAVVSHS